MKFPRCDRQCDSLTNILQEATCSAIHLEVNLRKPIRGSSWEHTARVVEPRTMSTVKAWLLGVSSNRFRRRQWRDTQGPENVAPQSPSSPYCWLTLPAWIEGSCHQNIARLDSFLPPANSHLDFGTSLPVKPCRRCSIIRIVLRIAQRCKKVGQERCKQKPSRRRRRHPSSFRKSAPNIFRRVG